MAMRKIGQVGFRVLERHSLLLDQLFKRYH